MQITLKMLLILLNIYLFWTNKVITAKYMFDWNEIEWVTTATTVREAVFTTAGEYRTPFYMFRTRKEEGGNE